MDYVRYLRSKGTVDDRALNTSILLQMDKLLREYAKTHKTITILEVGGGIGAMCKRLKDRHLFSNFQLVEYVMIDIKQDVLIEAKHYLLEHLQHEHEHEHEQQSSKIKLNHTYHHHHTDEKDKDGDDGDTSSITLCLNQSSKLNVSFVKQDALMYCKQHTHQFNLIIGCAVLDLWNLEQCLPILVSTLKVDSMSLYYFPINFDGVTDFFPASCEGYEYDKQIESRFHNSMGHYYYEDGENRSRIQSCETGRRLISILHKIKTVPKINKRMITSQSSSWIITPTYKHDEQYFLLCIIQFIENSVMNTLKNEEEKDRFRKYIEYRKSQINNNQLFYIAHNIDVFGMT